MDRNYESTPAPMETPWGPAQDIEEIAPGIVSVSTAGHGGIWISPERYEAMPTALRAYPTFTGSRGWYEEDSDALIVIAAFPDAFPASAVASAMGTIEAAQGIAHLPSAFGALHAGWTGPSRRHADEIARGWREQNAMHWKRGSSFTKSGGWLVFFRRVSDGEKAKRHLTSEEYHNLPFVSPTLPGLPA